MTEVPVEAVVGHYSMLPDTWTRASLKELGIWLGGGTPSKRNAEYWEGGTICWFSPKDMKVNVLLDSEDKITPRALLESSAKPVPANSLAFVVRSGILRRTLPIALTGVSGSVNQDIRALVPHEGIYPKYLYWAAVAHSEDIRRTCSKAGTTVESINVPLLQEYVVPVAPTNEQYRIVEKIEELFTKLDAGVDALKKAQALLKRYRKAVLKAAVTGELSREWRRQHVNSSEDVAALFERILAARREKWEGNQYRSPEAPDVTGLPSIPATWHWVRLDTLASIKGGITKDSKRKHEDARSVPYLRVANVQRGYLDLAEMKEIEATETVIEQLRLRSGDILFNEGGDRDKLGRGWVWNSELAECIHQNHVFRARPYLPDIQGKFVSWFGNTFGKDYFMRQGRQTTNLASINLSKLRAFPVPLPPVEEQQHIVGAVERLLSVMNTVETAVAAELRRSEGLRYGILKQAFTGRLVNQDPSDEPASALLERINAGRKRETERIAAKGQRIST